MAWMEMDYSKHTHFRWTIKWQLHALGIMGETAPFMTSNLHTLGSHIVYIVYSYIPGYPGMRRFASEISITSSSSLASGPLSMFSDGRSSSVMSVTQGSYAPESYLTDGYESETYITSLGSSVSQTAFREKRDPR